MARSAQNLATSAYAARQKDAGFTRINVVLSPEDMAAIGVIMKRLRTSRQEAVRHAIRKAAKAEAQS